MNILAVLTLSFLLPHNCEAVKNNSLSSCTDSLLIVFWNIENFFDPKSGNGPKGWSASRYKRKRDAIAKTILLIAEKNNRLPDAIGFAEIENEAVMKDLLLGTNLRKIGYRLIHYDSQDHRGIDCALFYRSSALHLIKSEPKHLYDSLGKQLRTRDILLAQFANSSGDSLALMVNHHPSQIGGKTQGRQIAISTLFSLADSLLGAHFPNILAVGDFNEDYWHNSSKGTIKYNGAWEKIDGHFSWGHIRCLESIFDEKCLSEKDKSRGGIKPRRTFIGPRYNGGVSDHYPIVVTVYF